MYGIAYKTVVFFVKPGKTVCRRLIKINSPVKGSDPHIPIAIFKNIGDLITT